MPMEQDPRLELYLEDRYHKNMMWLSAIDALLHRITDNAVLKWLNGGPRPRYAIPLFLRSHPYFTREAARSMENAGDHHEYNEDFNGTAVLIQLV